MPASETSRSPSVRTPLLHAVLVTLAWHVVLFAAAFGLPPTAPSWFPDLGATVVGVFSLRLHIGVIWPLALLHGLGNWVQVNSFVAAHWMWQLAVALGYVAAAWLLTRPSALPVPERWGAARMSG